MKYLPIAFILCFQISFGQTDSTIYFKEFGWTIKLPDRFRIVDADSAKALNQKGSEMIEKANNLTIDTPREVTLFAATSGQSNYFTSTYMHSDKITIDNWEMTDSETKRVLYNTLKNKIPITPDTVSSILLLDGIKFKKLDLSYKFSAAFTMKMSVLSTFYKEDYWVISYLFTNKETGEEIINMLNNSSFNK